MALIKCPECGKEITAKAEACPNCGLPSNHFTMTYSQNQQKGTPCSLSSEPSIVASRIIDFVLN
jgi:predicted amidophosphoribosyltransferase